MPRLQLTCLPGLQISVDGQPVEHLRSVKNGALLAYLAIEGPRAQNRSTLAGLLWPDEAEPRARRNLNQILLHLRRELGDTVNQPPFLLVTKQTIGLNPASDHRVDVVAFEALLAAVDDHTHADLTRCEACSAQLRQAVALYQGSFLEHFTIPGSDLFDQWVQTTREKLHRQAVRAFMALSNCSLAQGDLATAQQAAQRLLLLAPWQEEAHRQLMLVLALSGQRSQALAQYDQCTQMLMDELGVPPAAETDALYDQILAGELGPATSGVAQVLTAPTPVAPPFQALSAPPYFVGREAEIARLHAALTTTGAPICALVGMGGAGKSTLAIQMAHLLRADFADGVLWANAASSEPLDILASWARAYGYDFSGLADLESRAAAVRGVLAEKKVLIVLDNVLEASDVRSLAPGGAHNPVLLTTRDLDVAHALNAQALLLGELSPASSRLLLARILGDERVQAEEEAAARVGLLLHYLPLAVEIVAQRLKSRPRQRLAQMAARLGDTQQRLGLEISDRAVRASFEVSWEGLDSELRRAFTLAAVFDGRPFTAAAIAYVADADLDAAEDWLYALEALSLVRAEGAIHYRQHPLLADFAREKLSDAAAAFARMTAYYYGFAQENRQNSAALEPEWDNIMAGMHVARQLEQASLLIDYAELLDEPWFRLAQYGRARQGLRWAYEAAQNCGDEATQIRFLIRWGYACCEQSDFAEAEPLLKTAEAQAKQIGDPILLADAQYHLARIALERGAYEDADQLLADCQDAREQVNDRSGVAKALHLRAILFLRHGDAQQAETLGLEALAIQEHLRELSGILDTLRLLADCAFAVNEYVTGEQYARRALDLLRGQNNKAALAETHYTLARACRYRERLEAAWSHTEHSRQIFEHIGNQAFLSYVFYEQSFIKSLAGDMHLARQLGLKSLALMTALQDDYNRVFCLRHVGDLHHSQGRMNEARQLWREGEQLALSLHHPQTSSFRDRLQSTEQAG